MTPSVLFSHLKSTLRGDETPLLPDTPARARLLIEQARHHGVSVLLRKRYVDRNLMDRLDSELRAELDRDLFHTAQEALRNERLILWVADLFEEREIPHCFLKGRTFEILCYDFPDSVRPASDVDVLVPPEEERRARQALEEAGFRSLVHHPEKFLSPLPGGSVDLHTHLVNVDRVPSRGGILRRFDRAFWGRRGQIRLHEKQREKMVFVPGMEDTILHGSLHTILHHGGTRLLNWYDLDRALWQPTWSFKELRELAEKQGIERILAAGLITVESLFKTPLPKEAAEWIHAKPARPARVTLGLLKTATDHPNTPITIRFPLTFTLLRGLKEKIRFARETLLPSNEVLASSNAGRARPRGSGGLRLRIAHTAEGIGTSIQLLFLGLKSLFRSP